jgi:exopolyphosphatase / guanosine-5'-triphosphate,3'-diphosphate pyrophosphatase
VCELERLSGLHVEILPGLEEARLGFLGMANAMDVSDGFLIDIGGGSTEISLFRSRRLVHSVSFPFGSVNTTKRYTRNGETDEQSISRIRQMVDSAIGREPWIKDSKGLPLIGLGGTIRSLCRLDQRMRKYSLPLTHNYVIGAASADQLVERITNLSVENRKKVEGMSKERADIIVPGLVILQTIFKAMGATHYVVSGTGLRDGLFYEMVNPSRPMVRDVLEHSVHNLLALHPFVPLPHVAQVNRLAVRLFDDMQTVHKLGGRERLYLHTASLLYRIGVTVSFYNYAKHTFYVMAHSRINGLTHREIILCAMIASFKSKNRARQLYSAHKSIISEQDCAVAVKLGSLLQLAIALDRSETQPVRRLHAVVKKRSLELQLQSNRDVSIELREVATLEKEFRKVWNLLPRVVEPVSSRS